MTEWEKLLSGSVYNDFDEDLFNRRVRAKNCFDSTIKAMTAKLNSEIKL